MLLVLKNYKVPSTVVLRRAGYRWRDKERDFVLDDAQGRWHAKLENRRHQVWSLHYDLNVDGRHVSGLYTPIKHAMERNRIMWRSKFLEKYQISDEHRRELLDRLGLFVLNL